MKDAPRANRVGRPVSVTRDQERKVLRMRSKRFSFAQIGAALGITMATARYTYLRAAKEAGDAR